MWGDCVHCVLTHAYHIASLLRHLVHSLSLYMVPCNHKQSVNPGKLMFTGEDVESCGTGVAVWPVRLCGCVRTLDSPLSGISDTTSVFAGIYINASNSQPHPRTSSCSVQCVCAYREDKPTDALSDEGEDNREKKHLHLLPPRHTLGNQKPTDTHTSNLSETALENQVVVWMDQRYCTCCVNQECYCMAADGSGNASIRVSTDGKAGCISTTGDAAHAHKLHKVSRLAILFCFPLSRPRFVQRLASERGGGGQK